MNKMQPLSFAEFSKMAFSGWQIKVQSEMKGDHAEEKLACETYEDFLIRPHYHQGDLAAIGWLPHSRPGCYPYVRGARQTPASPQIRQEIVSGSINEAAAVAKKAVEEGIDALSFTSRIHGQKLFGVALSQQADMTQLLEGIDLTHVKLYFDFGTHTPIGVAFFLNELERRQVDCSQVMGGFLADPIADILPYGYYQGGSDHLIKRCIKLYQGIKDQLPQFKPVTIKGWVYRNAGSSAVQELAFALSSAVEYLDHLTDNGVTVAAAQQDICFSFSSGSDLFMEVAKLRAARLLWSLILKQFSGGDTTEIAPMNMHVRSSFWNKSQIDPHMNIVRTTGEGIAAFVGGCDALSILPYDESYAEPTMASYDLARVVAQILEKEVLLSQVNDPFGGAYYIETLTNALCEKALALVKTIEGKGGMLSCILEGFVQREIAKVRSAQFKNVACGRDGILRVNINAHVDHGFDDAFKAKPSKALVKQAGEDRQLLIDPFSVEQLRYALNHGFDVADLACIEYRGEDLLRFEPLRAHRGAEQIEKIRRVGALRAGSMDGRILVHLVLINDALITTARAQFVRSFMAMAGWKCVEQHLADPYHEGASGEDIEKAQIVVLVGPDDRYPLMAKELFAGVTLKYPHVLKMVVGYPITVIDTLKSFGTDEFIHSKTNATEFFVRYGRKMGIDL